ncbi:general transcription factor IIF subunit 1 [Spea bombifrons]|uniref:general transcription factor IIF subunit 1 n=1 Tax=Spea bombifrons TaxID=233779 RepID=UPI00234A95AA|nr:general transcription factor IIF subunit 1 [Spea bombifrons]XP_053318603.1 general transcription factor IIF subunit 1 [Spea bombifrons]
MTSLNTSQSSSGQSVTEYVVRVPRNPSKRYNLMAFNAADKVDFSTWNQARMERDLSAKKMYQEEELPDSGAGSEFNRKQREESRRKKYGIILKEFKTEDQPWVLRVNGKAGRRYKGVKKGGVTENASYYIFTQCPDGAFEAFPVSNWYNFTPLAKHRTLTAEEAEQEWERRNKILNHFSIMQQRRLKDQGGEDDEEEGAAKQDKGGKNKKKKKKNDLKIHDLDDEPDSSSESEESGEEGERRAKPQKKPAAQSKKKKKRESDNEALEDSDDGDFEGQEVDYMSDESSSDDELPGKPKPTKEEDVPKGIDEDSESSEESEEEKAEEEEEEEKKAPTPQEKKKKRDSSDESDTSEDSDIDGEASSALFMQKKKTPPKKDKKGGSNNSSRGNSRPGTPSPDSGNTSNTLRAAANKLEQGKRGAASHTPAAKRLKMDSAPQNASGKSTPQPQSGKSTPSSGDIQLTEDAVRRYLTRKPMTTKDLLKKFQTKKTGLSSEQTVNVLAQILKRLNPDRKIVHDKMHFYLKE